MAGGRPSLVGGYVLFRNFLACKSLCILSDPNTLNLLGGSPQSWRRAKKGGIEEPERIEKIKQRQKGNQGAEGGKRGTKKERIISIKVFMQSVFPIVHSLLYHEQVETCFITNYSYPVSFLVLWLGINRGGGRRMGF